MIPPLFNPTCQHQPDSTAIVFEGCPLCTREKLVSTQAALALQIEETAQWRQKAERLGSFIDGLRAGTHLIEN